MKCILPSEISTKKVVFFTAAFLQALFGCFTLGFRKDIYQTLLNSQLVVREGTESFKAWRETPMPVFTKFYFYSIINPEDFQLNHAKPILEEKGPYVFREKEEKTDIVWNQNSTVSYRRRKVYWFEPELSVGPLTDSVMTLNLPLVGAADSARTNFFMQWGLADIFATMEATLFINKTIGELMFEGYEDELVSIGDAFMEEEEKAVPMDKFGWFYKRNGTTFSSGDLSMHTGEDDISLLGKISTWNHKTQSDAFSGECGKVRGSSDGLFAPGTLAMKDRFELWSTDICRPLTFQRDGVESVHGISVDKFLLSKDVFANKTECAENSCYNNNLPSGVQNVTQCKLKSPAFISRPHFLGADPFYLDQFQYGIHPDPERHESSFLIEPKSSIPLKVSMKLQINILLEKNEGINYIFKDLPRVFYPVFWFESEASLEESQSDQIAMLVNLPVIMETCGIIGIFLGLVGMLIILICSLRSKKSKPDLVSCEYGRVSVKEQEALGVKSTPILRQSLLNIPNIPRI